MCRQWNNSGQWPRSEVMDDENLIDEIDQGTSEREETGGESLVNSKIPRREIFGTEWMILYGRWDARLWLWREGGGWTRSDAVLQAKVIVVLGRQN